MHVKLAPYVLGIIALILISAGVSKSFAFDIVTSPIWYQTHIWLWFSNVNDGGMCGSHYRAVLSYSGVFLEYTANNGRPTFWAFANAKKISDDLDFLFTYISQCNPYFTGIKSNKLFNKKNSLIYASPYNFFLDW